MLCCVGGRKRYPTVRSAFHWPSRRTGTVPQQDSHSFALVKFAITWISINWHAKADNVSCSPVPVPVRSGQMVEKVIPDPLHSLCIPNYSMCHCWSGRSAKLLSSVTTQYSSLILNLPESSGRGYTCAILVTDHYGGQSVGEI